MGLSSSRRISLSLLTAVGLSVLALASACARGSAEDYEPVAKEPAPTEPEGDSVKLPGASSGTPGSSGTSGSSGQGEAGAGDAATEAGSVPDAGSTSSSSGSSGLPGSLANNLLFHMTLDNGLAVDATGQNAPANITASNLTPTTDRFNNAVGATRFAASPPSLIQVGPPNNMPLGASPRSLSLWVRPRIAAPAPTPSRPNSNVFVHWGIDDCTSKMFGIGHLSNKGFGWTGCVDINSNLAIPVGAWTFVAMTYDAAKTMTLVVGNQTAVLPNVTLATTAGPLAIGGERHNYGQGFVYYFDGDLDDVRVWSRALSPAELAYLAAN